MGVWRKWIFPIIRIVAWVVIAAALAKLAFFGASASDTPLTPTGAVTDPRVAVSTGSVHDSISITGTVNADSAVNAKSSVNGEIVQVLVHRNQVVKKGAALYRVKGQLAGSTSIGSYVVNSPVAGTVASLAVQRGQFVSIGQAVASVAPSTFNVSGTLDPAAQYRLLDKPSDATVQIAGGPAPFTCTGLTISTPLAGADDQSGQTPTTTVRCKVPADVTVFSGLSAKITIAGGQADNVLLLPITAVDGTSGNGNVYLVQPDGSTVKTPVTLGVTDGTNVEVTSGVKEGDQVLEFVPGADDPSGGGVPAGCKPIGGGGMECVGGIGG